MAVFISHHSKNPFFNLAAEEYFLHQLEDDVVFLYENENAVVLGKHQNAFDECNITFCEANNIHIIRRLSGGGTVFHGSGNLNFCFIKNGEHADKLIDFKKHLTPINEFLHSLEVRSEFSGRNDLLVDGFKISGNAEHVFSKKKRLIHHGTLLFNADLKRLNAAIKPKENIVFKSHAVKSVRSKVANISDFMKNDLSFEQFKSALADFLISHFECKVIELTENQILEIENLIQSKYQTSEWNLRYSPNFEVVLTLPNSVLELKVEKGLILHAKLDELELIELKGKNYAQETLSNRFPEIDFSVFF
ncbi:MAG: lipoate--protein ligase family protein [Flavobacteriales bacterium]|nr:lipoate--protein ligase family protein [Flavobacteriales bacterium]